MAQKYKSPLPRFQSFQSIKSLLLFGRTRAKGGERRCWDWSEKSLPTLSDIRRKRNRIIREDLMKTESNVDPVPGSHRPTDLCYEYWQGSILVTLLWRLETVRISGT